MQKADNHLLLDNHLMASQVEVQTQIFVWSDFPDRKYLWSDFPDGNSLWSDFPDPKYLWSDFPDTKSLWSDFSDRRCSDQTIFRPWSRLKFRQLPRPYSDYDRTQVRSKRLWSDPVALEAFMVRPTCACSHLWSDSNALEIVWSEKNFTYEKIS